MKKLLIFLLLMPCLVRAQQTVITQQNPVASNPSSPTYNRQTFKYANTWSQLTQIIPVFTTPTFNNSTPQDGAIGIGTVDSAFYFYLRGVWRKAGGGGSDSLYVDTATLTNYGTISSPLTVNVANIGNGQVLVRDANGHLWRDTTQYLPNTVISGLGMSATEPSVTIGSGVWRIHDVLYSKGTSTTLSIDSQDPTLSRYDEVYADASNTLHIVSGTLSADPTPPPVPANTVDVGSILITPTSVTTLPNPPITNYVNTTTSQDNIKGPKRWNDFQIYRNSISVDNSTAAVSLTVKSTHGNAMDVTGYSIFKGQTQVTTIPVSLPDVLRKADTAVWINNRVDVKELDVALNSTINSSIAAFGSPLVAVGPITSYINGGGGLAVKDGNNNRRWQIVIDGVSSGVPSTLNFGYEGGNTVHGVKLKLDTSDFGQLYDGNGVAYLKAGGGGVGTVTSVTSANANATVANTTTTPVITIVAAPKWTTARNLAGNSVDGSANVPFANKFIVQGTSDAGLTNAQFLGSLGTGLVKNTTTTGVLSIAAAGTDYQVPLSFTSPLVNTSNTISIPAATTSVNGYLTSTDWNTFNGKQASGNYITALTGDVTASGPGSAATSLKNTGTAGTYGTATFDAQGRETSGVVVTPYANGGTNAATSWTQGSIIFAGTSAYSQDNANFFYDGTNHRLGVGTTAPTHSLTLASTATGNTAYNTSDQTTNYERLTQSWGTNVFSIFTEKGGTGTLRSIAVSGNTVTIQNAGTTIFTAQSQSLLGRGSITGSAAGTTSASSFGVMGAYTNSAGTNNGIAIIPTITGTSTQATNALWISPFFNTVGSGSQYLINAGTNSSGSGSGTHTPVFTVDRTGIIFSASLTASLPIFTDASKNLTNTGVVPIANGGTGSATQNFVDLTTSQTKTNALVLSLTGTANSTPLKGFSLTGSDAATTGLVTLAPDMYFQGGYFSGTAHTIAAVSRFVPTTAGGWNWNLYNSTDNATPTATGFAVSNLGRVVSPGSTITNGSGAGILLNGASSGVISVLTQAAAGTYNFNLPITAGTAGQVLTSQAGGSTAMTWSAVPIMQATADLAAQSAAGNVTTFTVGASTATFNVSGYINITAVTVDVIEMQVTYTDENSTSQTANFFTQGATSALLSAIGNSVYPPMVIRAKNGTVITVKTTLTTGTGSIAFDTGGRIQQL